ncbi:putative disease resistance protein [Nymphaea thermarum]|nr:putative disease resistance protein [Nymphaea thermarum]
MAIVIEALAEKAISSLLDAVTSLLREEVDLILNAKDELKKLQRKLERLEVSLKDVDHKPFFSSERDRYLEGELKDVFYDAQDIIEKYQTEIKISKWEKDSLTSWNKVRKPWIILHSCFKEHVHASHKFSNETKKINERLDAIKKDWEMVDPLKTTPNRRFEDPVHGEHDNSRETTHHMGAQTPTGREDDKREIVKRLLSDDSAHTSMTKKGSVSIISIVGKGGIGKTTLAKMVFSEIEQQFGERRWWVCVSERPNREDLLQKILKEVCKKSKEDIFNSSLSELCTQLRNELSKEKFLLVLDDVWELNWWKEEVEGTLMAGAMGSKILITSRKKDVSEGMGACYMHPLPEFSFHQSWELFIKEALGEGGREYSHASPSQHTRHMSLLDVDNVKETMHNATATTHKLRTLLGASSSHLTNFKWLRVLSLRGYRMYELPNSIQCLALLKYLDLSGSKMRRLPSSIGRLCNLQTLDLSDSKIEELPKEMGKLCNLRYLGLKHTEELKFIAEGLGKLTNLRTLHRFLVSNDKGKTSGSNIRELKDLNKLKGELSIEGLRVSRKAIDLVGNEQLLKEKHGIISLLLNFGFDKQSGASEQSGVLEALEPPLGLECLKISDYKGKMPAWYLKTEYYTMLHSLKLDSCSLWEKLICITSLKALYVNNCRALCEIASMPALESLEVKDCGKLEQLPRHMPALKSLKVDDLPNWEGWPAGGSGETTFTSMSCLREADFANCPKMQTQCLIYALSQLAGHEGQATQLRKLSVRNCPSARLGWKLLEQLPGLIRLELDSKSAVLVPSPLPSEVSTFLPSLRILYLTDTIVDEEFKWGRVPQWVWGLSQLEELLLNSFSEEISLGGHLQCLPPKLRTLKLFNFRNLKSLVDITAHPNENDAVATCPTDANEQISCLSKLDRLEFWLCPALDLPQELIDQLGGRMIL